MTIDELVNNMIRDYINYTECKMTESLDIKADTTEFEKHLNSIRNKVDDLGDLVECLKLNSVFLERYTNDTNKLRADAHHLRQDVNVLRSELDALTEKPKQKSLLEIFKQKDELDTIISLTNNPFLKGE